MHPVARLRAISSISSIGAISAVCALTLTLTSVAAAQLSGGESCAPNGLRAPRLSLLVQVGSPNLLYLQADPALTGGGAMLLFEDPFGPDLPPGPCVDGLNGRMIGLVQIGAQGRASWNVPAIAVGKLPTLRALAWPVGGSWADVHVTNTIVLPPHQDGAPSLAQKIVISEFQKNPTTVSDGKGEWIEIHNAGEAPVDLEGWILADLGTDQTVLDNGGQGMVVPPGGYLVLGREADPAQNGGVPVDFVYSGVILSNGEDEIVLIRPDGIVADQVLYDDGVDWPDENGRAISLDPSLLDSQSNDDGANWCSATTLIGAGPDTGTPGAANDDCGG